MINQIFSFILLLSPLQADSWQSSEYIWDFGLILGCDKGLNRNPKEYFEKDAFDPSVYENVAEGDIVWVKSCFVKRFYKKALPLIKNRFILVISDGDESFPSNARLGKEVEKFINHEKIIHIFAQNCECRGKKVSPVPIGVDFHTQGYKWNVGERKSPAEQEEMLKGILGGLKPTGERNPRAFVDFQHNNTMKSNFRRDLQFGEDRVSIFEQLKKSLVIDYSEKLSRYELWKKKGEYAFSISPPGNGLDCHRTWEDLILGCIVIVKTSPLDPLYEGLPVVIVKDWAEVTETNLRRWQERYKDAFTNPAYRVKLTNAYWLEKIRGVSSLAMTKAKMPIKEKIRVNF